MVDESLDIRSYRKNILLRYTLENGLFKSELSSSLREIRFNTQELATGIVISNIKYYHPGLQNNKLFYPFHNQVDYALTHYFIKFETNKDNIDKILSIWLMAPLIEKLFY